MEPSSIWPDTFTDRANGVRTAIKDAAKSEERLRALIDAFGVAAEQYGYSRKAYPRSAAAIHAENQRAESRRVLLDEVQRSRASLVEATRDSTRLAWCYNRSAMLFRRETPEPMVMLMYFPLKQDGFTAAECEGRDVPVSTKAVTLSAFATVHEAARSLIDRAASLHTDTP